jgi:hypothetical protein
MLKKHKNVFVDIIKTHGLNENLFRSKEFVKGDLTYFIIEMMNSPLKFCIMHPNVDAKSFACRYTMASSGHNYLDDIPDDYFTPSFTLIHETFSSWLTSEVKDYLDELLQPDYWQQINEQDDLISGDLISEDGVHPSG